jgi:hypothetical protein
MRGRGYTVAARSIEECVFRAIYTRENATIQTASLGLSAAYRGTGDSPTEIQYLRDDEIEGATGDRVNWMGAGLGIMGPRG